MKKGKKRNIILIIIGFLLLVVLLFILWFFNRKFEVTFDYNNGTSEDVILVKYNKIIDKKYVKGTDDLGDLFIDWYLVLDKDDNNEKLSSKPFDFNTKIDENIKLKAVYKKAVEKVVITFDSKGGNKISPISINKGSALVLPKNPERNGYVFKGWFLKNGKQVKNKTVFNNDSLLIAKWEKKEVKKETPKKEVKKETPKKEESISLSLSNNVISRNGTKTSKASASVKNASGSVVYSITGNCSSINSKSGAITASGACNGEVVTVKATLPSGKSASKKLTIEKDLVLTVGNDSFSIDSSNKRFNTGSNNFTIVANQKVSWSASGVVASESTSNSTTYKGKGNHSHSTTANVTARTTAGQRLEIYCYTIIN